MSLKMDKKDEGLSLMDELLLDDFDKYELETGNNCEICCKLIENPIILDCNHKFCYNCLLQSFKGKKCNYSTKPHRICPYCRAPSSYLPLKEGLTPVKGIHREFYIPKFKSLKLCQAIIKTGINKGKKCGCRIKSNEYCGRHKLNINT